MGDVDAVTTPGEDPLRLAIDTTGHGGAVILASGGRVLAEAIHDEAQGYAEHLFGLLDEVLVRAGVSRAEIEEIAVVGGPGSFTGLRIGVMTAKTLAATLGRPLRAAGTLPLIASAATGPGIALANAGGGCVWRLDFEGPAPVGDAVVRRVEIGDLPGSADLFTSDRRLVETLTASGRAVHTTPSLARLLVAARAADHPSVVEVDAEAYVPEYVSPSQAERVHGVDLTEELARPIRPRGWD